MNIIDCIKETQQDCISLQHKIKELYGYSKNSGPPPSGNRDILVAKLSTLNIETDLQKDAVFVPPVKHPLAARALLLQELDETIEQSKKISQVVTTRCAALTKTTEEKENLILQQNRLHDALSVRLEDLQSHRFSTADEDTFVKRYGGELSAKKKACEKQSSQVKKKLSIFTSKHFPYPNFSGNQHGYFKGTMPHETLVSLDQLINNLISLAVNKPESPYLTLGCQHWSQYIELLLSYGLVSHHPSDINKIKLSDMHL